jgi:hypothetical protein
MTEELLTSLGIGEAIVTVLSEKGTPTPLAHTLMRAPATRMDVLAPNEIQTLVNSSSLARKYNEVIDRESAFEILEKRLNDHREADREETDVKDKPAKEENGALEKLSENTMVRQIGHTVASAAVRGLLGVFGLKTTTRRKRGLFG